MKNIAVITGASSGIGRKFAEALEGSGMNFDEVWVIARRADRLNSIESCCPVRAISLDLTDRASFTEYKNLLDKEQPNVKLLINSSGFGIFQAACDVPLEDNLNMVDLNCQAVMAMCQMTIPYMSSGARIINIASVAALQPIPYINVYAATKAFVLSYSRALNRELRRSKITVTAVCPFWTKTEFFNRAVVETKDRVVKYYAAMYTTDQIVKRAWKDSKKGKDVSKFGFVARGQAALTKILPHSIVMSFWMKQQKLK
jgi:short-subunit dehydrogenase